jgi:tetratricopeptide (TPR) repeat protein/energy-coupling factor transporter ATP-binding protein EcfA2
MNNTPHTTSNGDAQPYPSIGTLREVHVSLLKRHREGETVGFLNEVEKFLRRGSATGTYLDSHDDRETGQSLLDYWATVLYRAKRTPPDATLAEFDVTQAPVLEESACPYRGLNAFQELDSSVFFGRHRLTEQLVKSVQERPIVFVVGQSGSGKSSVVLAGLIPALKNGVLQGSDKWQYLPRIVPGTNPLKNLAYALDPQEPQSALQVENFKRDEEHLLKLIHRRGVTPAVVVVDQFEEAFTLCADDAVREAFVANLVRLAEDRTRRNIVVFTIRSDYEDKIASIAELLKYFEGALRVMPLSAADLRDAIEQPAAKANLKFEEGIVDALVKDILGEPAGLPLLQFTLLRLWKMRNHNRISWRSYRELGGARRALALTAEEFYQSLPENKKILLRRIMLRMTRPSEGFEVMSYRVKRATLYTARDPREPVDELIEALVRVGLVRLTQGDNPLNDQVEVAHEALVRNWPTLVEWLETERVALRQRFRLTTAANQWLDHGKDPGGLLGGSLLEEALRYDDLNEVETEFLQSSVAAAEQAEWERREVEERAQEAAQREKKLDRARIIALEQTAAEVAKNAKRLRQFLTVLALLLVFAMGTAVYAWVARTDAIKNERRAHQQQELAEAQEKEAVKYADEAKLKREEAHSNYLKAEEEKKEAKKQRDLAEVLRKKAEAATELAKAESLRARQKAAELTASIDREKKARSDADRYSLLLQAEQAKDKEQIKLMELHRDADAKFARNKLREANPLDEDLLARYRATSDEEHRNVELVLSRLATVYRKMGEVAAAQSQNDDKEKYTEAADKASKEVSQLFDEQLEKKRQQFGAESVQVIPVLEDLAQFHLEQTNFTGAEAAYLRALDIQEKNLSKDDDEGQQRYDAFIESLVKLYDDTFEMDKITPLYERSLKAKERVVGAETPDVHAELHKLARLYREQDKTKEAEDSLLRAMKVAEKLDQNSFFGEDLVLKTARVLGDFYTSQQKYTEAEKFYDRALTALQVDRTQAESPEAAGLFLKLADTYQKMEQNDKALEVYSKVLNYYQMQPEKFGSEIASTQISLGMLTLKLGDLARADAISLTVLNFTGKGSVPSGSITPLLRKLASEYEGAGKLTEAEVVYKRALEFQIKSRGGTDNSSVYDSLNQVGQFYERHGKIKEAEAVYDQALKIVERVFGVENSAVVPSLKRLAKVYGDAGKNNEAEEFYQRAIRNLEKVNSPSTKATLADMLKEYAALLTKLKRHEQAEQLLTRAKSLEATATASPTSR